MTATTDRLDTHAEVNGIRQERHVRTAIPGPTSQSLQMRKLAAVANGIGTTLPVFIERAGGGIVVDVDGNSLIDLGSGIAVNTVGNANSEVVAAVQKQVADFTHTCFTVTPYLGYVEVCEELNRLTPGTHAKRSALFNSGAEAVENAVKIARSFTRRNAVVVLEHAYHGRTNLTMGLTAKNMPYKNSFGPFAPEIYRVPMSYPFRDGGLTGPEIAAAAILSSEKPLAASNAARSTPSRRRRPTTSRSRAASSAVMASRSPSGSHPASRSRIHVWGLRWLVILVRPSKRAAPGPNASHGRQSQ
jgi:4-aminobutyrate aminotransferase/(S)-3-amino-2-methylpropionate transaminase